VTGLTGVHRPHVRVLGASIAFLAGAATMAGELAAVRLLAPWFGASTIVWTNVIGVVLLALSLGYLLGARWANGAAPWTVLSRALCAGGLLLAAAPHLVAWYAQWFLPANLALDAADGVLQWGRLATAGLVFLPPMVALGCVSPLIVEWWTRATQAHAGSAGGFVLAASTLGSLLGTFVATHVLVPSLGLVLTFTVAGGVLVLVGVIVALTQRQLLGLLWLVPLAGMATHEAVATPAPSPIVRVLAQGESALQSVRVVEQVAFGNAPWRFLQVNESFDSFQSVWSPTPGLLSNGYYYDLFALPVLAEPARERLHMGIIGLGAGTAWRVVDGVRPASMQLTGEGAELDPLVVEYAHTYLDLPRDGTRLRVLSGVDGRMYLQHAARSVDVLVVDAYRNQTEIPAHLATLEFWTLCQNRLTEGGWLLANVGSFGLQDPLLQALARTLAQAFAAEVHVWRVPFARNAVLIARKHAQVPDPAHLVTGNESFDALLRAIARPEMHCVVAPPATFESVLSDDCAPLEALGARSLSRARAVARGDVTP